MKKKIYLCLFCFLPLGILAQNVGIGTFTPQSRLEVRDTAITKVAIASKSYSDTTQLILSNRTATNLGTDITLSANRERGLRVSSQSDLEGNRHDSIMSLTPQGRVGINNSNPAERLDVRGNVNITGTIKANGYAGLPNQVLMQDGSGNLAWGDMDGYKNFESYTTPGSGTWVVPTGVTAVLIEVTGGGSGGTIWGGGGGGGYVMAKLNVTPGENITYTVGSGSAGTAGANSTNAGYSTISSSTVTITANGGFGGVFNNSVKNYNSSGGSFSVAPSSFKSFIGLHGGQGQMSRLTFQQKSATAFYEIVSDGNGGGPGYCKTCITEGVHLIYDYIAAAILRYTYAEYWSVAGAGGGGGYLLTTGGFGGGAQGQNGRIVFRY